MTNTIMVGRPSKLNRTVVQKLEDSLRLGLNVSDSCAYAGISRSTFYLHLQNNIEFSDKITVSKMYIEKKAKALVFNAIEKGDLRTAKWFLEKYDTIDKREGQPVVAIKKEPELSENELRDRLEGALRALNQEGEYATMNLDPEAIIK